METKNLIRQFSEGHQPLNTVDTSNPPKQSTHYQKPIDAGQITLLQGDVQAPPPKTSLNSVTLPVKLRQSNGTKSRSIYVGEDFVLTCLSIKEIDGKKYLVTEIGTITLK